MLTIGEFSKLCQVSTKTLRYYEEIGLIFPSQINSENGYRYYDILQLKIMLFINRLKSYQFSLEEIKEIMNSNEILDEKLYLELSKKKIVIEKELEARENNLKQLSRDMALLKEGKSIMAYLDDIEVELVLVSEMNLLSVRKMVEKDEFPSQYKENFGYLMKKVEEENLTMTSSPMVLFHDEEFSPFGLDTEFAIPVKEQRKETRIYHPGTCLKTVLHGPYTNLPSIYTKQIEYAETHGYENDGPLYEVYVTDPSQVKSKEELVTEIYYPVIKRRN